MTRYKNFRDVYAPVDRQKVTDAMEMIHAYSMDIYEKLATVFRVSVSDSKVIFFSPPTDRERFFIEVEHDKKMVKIMLVGRD